MHTRTYLSLPLLAASLTLLACDDKPSQPEENAPPVAGESDRLAKPKEAQNPSPTKADSGEKSEDAGSASAKDGTDCLEGKWHYDFADDALETMMKNVPGAKVTKEEGELVCDIKLSGQNGSLSCAAAGGKPVVIEVTANQAGMPMSILVEMSGKTATKFKLTGKNAMELTSSAVGDLGMKVTAKIAGNEIPFPAKELLTGFMGEAGGTSSFECEGDELRVKPQMEGEVSWQRLKRIK